MGLDSFSPVAPARIRCLLLPCGRIRRSSFLAYVERLQQFNTVRLGDVSPNTRPTRSKRSRPLLKNLGVYVRGSADQCFHVALDMFSPLAFPSGLLVYEMMTASPTPGQLALVPFELYREPLVIIAIAEGKELFEEDKGEDKSIHGKVVSLGDMQSAESEDALDGVLRSVMELKEQYPAALVHQVFVFNHDKPEVAFPPSVVPVPSLENSKTTTMKTLMCDLTSLLLAEMTSYARSLQALPNVETPKPVYNDNSRLDSNSSSRPGSRILSLPGSRSSSPAPESEKKQNRKSMLPQVNSVSEPKSRDGSRARPQSAVYSTQPLAFDDMNGASGRSTPTLSSEPERPVRLSKEKIPVQGFGSGSVGERARNKAKGRIGVVIGSMYLLAGRWPDAMKELVESAAVARANSDHVWHAKALDYILVCMIMCAWGGMDFEVSSREWSTMSLDISRLTLRRLEDAETL